MHASLLDQQPRAEPLHRVFSRSARLALAGLIAAPALVSVASAAGHPIRGVAGPAFWAGALAGFGGAGWLAARRLGLGARRAAALAGSFLAPAVLVGWTFRSLQGVTGHESIVVVTSTTLPVFGVAFAAAGPLAARAIGISGLGLGGVAVCAAGGMLGGAFAILPFCWAWLRADVPGEFLIVMALAVVGFLGCLILPFHIMGLALDRTRNRR